MNVINGRTFESSPSLVHGDYVGAGSVGSTPITNTED